MKEIYLVLKDNNVLMAYESEQFAKSKLKDYGADEMHSCCLLDNQDIKNIMSNRKRG